MTRWDQLPTYTDQDGHLIRVTGAWCAACSYPMLPDHGDRHPLCAEPAPSTGP